MDGFTRLYFMLFIWNREKQTKSCKLLLNAVPTRVLQQLETGKSNSFCPIKPHRCRVYYKRLRCPNQFGLETASKTNSWLFSFCWQEWKRVGVKVCKLMQTGCLLWRSVLGMDQICPLVSRAGNLSTSHGKQRRVKEAFEITSQGFEGFQRSIY